MKHLIKIGIAALATMLLATAALADASAVYMRSNTGLPWSVTSNEDAMDMVFGSGNWYDARYETVDTGWLLSGSVTFIFMEGGDNNATALSTFLGAHGDDLNTWVSNGGRLLINAAPNEGANIAVGFGATLNFGSSYNTAGTSGYAPITSHAVFAGPFTPVGTNFPANFFSHAYISGSGFTAILNDDSDRPVLSEKRVGSGLVLVGGMTSDVFQDPQPNTHNLRANIISYAATHSLT